jgi:hypothetical protein
MATSGATPSTDRSFDWGKCIFCQKSLQSVKTNCPADSRRTDVGCGCKSLYDAVEEFAKLGQLPSDVIPFVQFWDEGNGNEATCASHRACWHIKCRQRFFHSTKLERLQKDLADINNNVTVECEVDADVNNCTDSDPVDPLSKMPRITRSASKLSATDDMSVCFFCGLPGADLLQVDFRN